MKALTWQGTGKVSDSDPPGTEDGCIGLGAVAVVAGAAVAGRRAADH